MSIDCSKNPEQCVPTADVVPRAEDSKGDGADNNTTVIIAVALSLFGVVLIAGIVALAFIWKKAGKQKKQDLEGTQEMKVPPTESTTNITDKMFSQIPPRQMDNQRMEQYQTRPQQNRLQPVRPQKQQNRPLQNKPKQTKPQQNKPKQTKPKQTKNQQVKPKQTKPKQTKPKPQQTNTNTNTKTKPKPKTKQQVQPTKAKPKSKAKAKKAVIKMEDGSAVKGKNKKRTFRRAATWATTNDQDQDQQDQDEQQRREECCRRKREKQQQEEERARQEEENKIVWRNEEEKTADDIAGQGRRNVGSASVRLLTDDDMNAATGLKARRGGGIDFQYKHLGEQSDLRSVHPKQDPSKTNQALFDIVLVRLSLINEDFVHKSRYTSGVPFGFTHDIIVEDAPQDENERKDEPEEYGGSTAGSSF